MIREARPADLPRLRALQSALPSPWPDLLDLAVEDAPGVVALVVDPDRPDGGAPVGYALAVPGEPAGAEPDATDTVYLAEVVVAPDHRREGHGTALVEAVADRFSAHDQLRLTARADDERALAFYRELGFWVLDELPDHYEAGDDAPADDDRAARVDGVLLARTL